MFALSALFVAACAPAPAAPDADAANDSAEASLGQLDASLDVLDDRAAAAEADAECEDLDRDGHRAASCGGDDCDDRSPLRHPGRADTCDGVDNDCNGMVDDARCSDSESAPTGFGVCAIGGECRITSCVDHRANCDGNDRNGCEIDVDVDSNHCGRCGARCRFGACAAGRCVDAEVVQIAADGGHACALYRNGSVVCWGSNVAGQTGDGATRAANPSPVTVIGVTDAVEITAGTNHTCARRRGGEVLCWGNNGDGQLGDGTSGNLRLSVVTVMGVSDAVEITAGAGHTCARRSTGVVVCWGNNAYGQLGDGTSSPNRRVPVEVQGITDAVEIGAGSLHTCARRATGQVLCWGGNNDGQLGDGTSRVNRWTPVAVSDLADAVEISVGFSHTCARRSTGEVRCWGSNGSGEIGDGTQYQNRLTPVAVSGITDAVELSTSFSRTCARLASGEVRCWGRNDNGELGDGTLSDQRLTPVPVTELSDAVELALGHMFSCARRRSGAVSCWGDNAAGQLGLGATGMDRLTPVAVASLTDAQEITAGSSHTCARRTGGSVLCWGNNAVGLLGAGLDASARFIPSPVTLLSDAAQISAGTGHTCAIRFGGTVVCWGSNQQGQFGANAGPANRLAPEEIPTIGNAVEISAGNVHTCARLASGEVRCWGSNVEGQCGVATNRTMGVGPVTVSGLTDAVEITAGLAHTCARRASGAVVCWGANNNGQIGDGSTATERPTPTAVVGLTDAVELSAGAQHTCARRAGGEVVCWGYNGSGQLGDGTSSNTRRTPVIATGAAGALDLEAGAWHTCARRPGGQVHCWGWNISGQLGDGTKGTDRLAPVAVVGVSDAVEITGGGYFTCVRRSSGAVLCWGSDTVGQLGDRSRPTDVVGL
ncbi:MAG: MopE-related protein [Polyangiales bacterium]